MNVAKVRVIRKIGCDLYIAEVNNYLHRENTVDS